MLDGVHHAQSPIGWECWVCRELKRTMSRLLPKIFQLIVEYIPWIVNLQRSILRWMGQAFDRAKLVLAENVRRRRQEVGMSQEALALSADVDRTYVSQIERGIGNPSLLILCKICDVLGNEPADLLASGSFREKA